MSLINVPDPTYLFEEMDELAKMFDMTRYRLGEMLCDAAADGIMANMMQEVDPDGNPWMKLSPGYAAEKELIVPGAQMGVLFGIMRTSEEICGVREIDQDSAAMGYGVSELARVEAVKFQEGGMATGTKQPPRPFYAFTEHGIILATEILDEHFLNYRPINPPAGSHQWTTA